MFILELESVAAVRTELAKDPYWTGDVVRVVVSPLTPCCSRLLLVPCSGIKKGSRSKRSSFPLLPRPPKRCQKPEFVYDSFFQQFCSYVTVLAVGILHASRPELNQKPKRLNGRKHVVPESHDSHCETPGVLIRVTYCDATTRTRSTEISIGIDRQPQKSFVESL